MGFLRTLRWPLALGTMLTARLAHAQDAGHADASTVETAASIQVPSEFARAFPLPTLSASERRQAAAARVATIRMNRCNTEFTGLRIGRFSRGPCHDAWEAVESILRQNPFWSATLALCEAPTAAEQTALNAPVFIADNWRLTDMVLSDQFEENVPDFAAFAVRMMATNSTPGGDAMGRSIQHLLGRRWGYDPSPSAPWGTATSALGDRAARQARVDAWSQWLLAHRTDSSAQRTRWGVAQSRRDLASADYVLRWRALERLLRRHSDRELHREAIENLRALWRDRTSLPAAMRAHLRVEISAHTTYWRVPIQFRGELAD